MGIDSFQVTVFSLNAPNSSFTIFLWILEDFFPESFIQKELWQSRWWGCPYWNAEGTLLFNGKPLWSILFLFPAKACLTKGWPQDLLQKCLQLINKLLMLLESVTSHQLPLSSVVLSRVSFSPQPPRPWFLASSGWGGREGLKLPQRRPKAPTLFRTPRPTKGFVQFTLKWEPQPLGPFLRLCS